MNNWQRAQRRTGFEIVRLIGVQLTLLIVFSCIFFILRQPLRTKIVACNVGQGDAIIIQYGYKRILIDTGPNLDVLQCLPQVAIGASKNIDVVILTHWDKDHIGGFASVLQKYSIGKIFANSPNKDTAAVEDLVKEMEKVGVTVEPFVGDTLIYPGLRLRFLWNAEMLHLAFRGKPESEENASSIGIEVLGKSFGFLSLGDLECTQELAVYGLPLLNPYQILKVSHHGAKTSSCLEFLQRSRPEIAIISVGGKNTYGHPAPQTLENLEKSHVFPMRTDQLGTFSLTKKNEGWMLRKGI